MLTPPEAAQMAVFPESFGNRFWVTIDTEEDFDWTKPFSRTHHGVKSLAKLGECQSYFSAQGVRPNYLVDWPVIQQPSTNAELRQWVAESTAEVGAQLHPWVTPPFDEVVNSRNSYTGNLPTELQRAKLAMLRDRIAETVGVAPLSYRAGRYGLGPETSQILSALGFACDTSVRSGFEYRAADGPDYRYKPLNPYWTKAAPDLLEVPLTSVFCGRFERTGQAEALYHGISALGSVARSLAARLQLVERIALTPEGIPANLACVAIDRALALGVRVLNFSFHSPSLEPGHTPYVRSDADLAKFYQWWDIVLAHLDHRGVRHASVSETVDAARRTRLPADAVPR